MSSLKKKVQVFFIVLLPLFFCACFSVHITKGIDNPRFQLRRARRQIERLHQRFPKRRRRAHSIHILVYERNSGHLVRFSAPLWIVNSFLDLGMGIARRNADFEFEEKYEIDWRALRNLGQIGPGLLVEVIHDEDRVLVWLK